MVIGKNWRITPVKQKVKKASKVGHVTGHHNIFPLANIVIHGQVLGKQGRGRLNKRWPAIIKEWTGPKPLTPNVKEQVPLSCPYIFYYNTSREKLLKYQENSAWMSMMLQGEIDADHC